ncbi:dynamin family protein [Saccharopolyspora sp. HNM0986]|uniref:dynamin family protein n=1 Tax=Saccharopolyspora galaxeae TaxID=2781241 RepID=UPI00190B36B9|nr:dynamin family protein [Saccharopolyspora sp. HNM0986]MBK0865211.1 dynamin family protein [Saccharopolyspora sp. HNM0986]
MTSAGPATGVPAAATALPQQVKQTRDKLFALLRQAAPDAAEWAEEVRRSRPDVPSVVVVGETNRGKSSLVNALLGHPDLSPVDAAVATSTYLEFRHGQRWCGSAHYPAQSEPVEFDVAELPAWASVRHELPEGRLPPRHLSVHAPLDTLTELTIVDTPGVGGLDSVHGELAAEAASAGTALLFVIDAAAPFTRGELEFLHRAADRVETVVFALAKTDQHRSWRQVLEQDRKLLAEHAPRFAEVPIHPVSARMLQLAAQAPSEQAAELLRERSGVAELRSALVQLVGGRAAMLGEANTMRALSTVLGELIARLEAETRALTVGADEAESLRARRDELAATRRSATRGWQVKLRGEIQRTRVEAGHEVTRQMREVQSWFRRTIDGADRVTLGELPAQVDAALQMVSSRVSALLSARLAKVAEVALAELFSAEELDVIRSQFARGAQSPIALRPPDKRPPTAEDKLLVFMGVSGGLGLGRAAAMPLAGVGVAVLNPVVLPVTIVLGLGAGWWMARTRKHAADKQHFKQWLTEAIADARSALDQLVSEQLIDAEQQLSLALDDALSRRIESIDEQVREVDKALKMDAAERGDRLRTANRRLQEAQAGRDRAEQLLRSVRALRDHAE